MLIQIDPTQHWDQFAPLECPLHFICGLSDRIQKTVKRSSCQCGVRRRCWIEKGQVDPLLKSCFIWALVLNGSYMYCRWWRAAVASGYTNCGRLKYRDIIVAYVCMSSELVGIKLDTSLSSMHCAEIAGISAGLAHLEQAYCIDWETPSGRNVHLSKTTVLC